MFFYGARISEVTEFIVPEKVSLQLSSEQSVGNVWIAQLDRKRISQARSRGCKSSVAVTAECSRHHASLNVS